jgi:cytochrome P450
MTQSTAWDRDLFVDLTDFREVDEVLRRGQEFHRTGTNAGSDEFAHGTLIAMDGRDHLNRRRALMKMIGADQPWGAEGSLIDEVFQANIRRVLETQQPRDGLVRFDLIDLASKLLWRVTAALVGLDDIDNPTKVERFSQLVRPVLEGFNVEYQPEERHQEILTAARENLSKIRAEIFDPSLERRRQLIAEAKTDDDYAALPADLVTSLLVSIGDREPDVEVIFREMITLLAGSVNNPVSQIAWAIDDVLPWLDVHPEHKSKIGSKEFLGHAVKETMRLHRTSRPHLVRIAAQDAVLESSGRVVPKGTWLACWIQAANRDAAVFGPDADIYDPYRTPLDPKVNPFGVGLGGGPHMCLGRPLLLWDRGDERAQGVLVKVLRFLLALGVRPDSDGVQHEGGPEGGRRYLRYDVVVPVPLKVQVSAGPG